MLVVNWLRVFTDPVIVLSVYYDVVRIYDSGSTDTNLQNIDFFFISVLLLEIKLSCMAQFSTSTYLCLSQTKTLVSNVTVIFMGGSSKIGKKYDFLA